MNAPKFDLYNNIHNALRSRLFSTSIKAGAMLCTDESSIKALYEEIESLKQTLVKHAGHEEKFIHPLLDERVPGIADELYADHRKFDSEIGKIAASLGWTVALSNDFEKKKEIYLEFRHNLNRFIAGYMLHLDKEDIKVSLILREVCTNQEIGKTLGDIIASQSPDESMETLTWMLPAINLEEQAFMINSAKPNIPPQAFKAVCELTQRILSAEAWSALKPRIGVE